MSLLAQWLEHLVYNRGIASSSLTIGKLHGVEGEHAEKSLRKILGKDNNPLNHLILATDKETSIHADEVLRAKCKTDE